ncbi:hypothetical protein IID24_02200 [Patescibacteria group bacterium]|nr:hypothetical protein [Patescibacteria group bacterium]
MDLDEIRQFIDKEGGKIIIVENNKPILVVFSYEEYREKGRNQKVHSVLPREVSNPAQPEQKQSNRPAKQSDRTELTIDDLPL